MARALVLILDSLGIGASADADRFGDAGSNTLGHIAKACAEGRADGRRFAQQQPNSGPLHLPHLERLGLLHALRSSTGQTPATTDLNPPVEGAWGYAREISSGKDTPSGHWEMAGVPVLSEWGYFPSLTNSFPATLLEALVAQAKLPGVLGNCHASGTEIIAKLGEEHIRTGCPIVYTSADSVVQIACHEHYFGLDALYRVCEIARKLVDEYTIGRVIARPFTGKSSTTFERTGNRRDLTTPPPAPTLLDRLVAAGGQVTSVGKIADIFAGQGISRKVRATGLAGLFDATLEQWQSATDKTLVITNFVDFDSAWGHRRDVAGYAAGLEYFDSRLPELTAQLTPGDLLVITADHGCDPTWPGSDHTREHVPVVVAGPGVAAVNLGERSTFADIGQTLCEHLSLSPTEYGTSFLKTLSIPANRSDKNACQHLT